MANDPTPPYRVLIVDDVPEVREALRWALENESDLMVVAEAGTEVDALMHVTAFTPDVVILDRAAHTRWLCCDAHPKGRSASTRSSLSHRA